MSPVERRSSSATTTAVLVGVAGVVAGLGLVVLMVNLASRGTESFEVRLGDDRFAAGGVERRVASIEDGGPILFSDVAGGSRDIILNHLGAEPDEGWYAFSAQPAGKARDCFLQWQADDGDFEDCDGVRYPADGDDPALTRYPVAIEDGELFVDINFEFRDRAGTDEPEGEADPG
jgi:hypothetical protein